MPNVESIPTAAMPMPYSPRIRFSAVSILSTSNPMAHKNAMIIAKAMVMTGIAVESIPKPKPEMITVAGPVCPLAATRCVGA